MQIESPAVQLWVAESDLQTGEILGGWRRLAANSFLKQWSRYLAARINDADDGPDDRTITLTDTSGTSRTVSVASDAVGANAQLIIWRANGGAGDDTLGIVVGTSNTAVGRDDYALGSKISNGSGTGQLDYQAVSISGPTAVTNGYRVTISRQVQNNSGAAITIRETGLEVQHANATTLYDFLDLRDLTGAVIISNGITLTFQYLVNFTTSNGWLKQMAEIYEAAVSATARKSLTDTSNDEQTVEIEQDVTASGSDKKYEWAAKAGSGEADYGILLGTSTSAVGRDDNSLGAVIAHGTSTGQLEYGAMSAINEGQINGGYRVTLSRPVTNSSSAPLTVEEVGLALAMYDDSGGSHHDILAMRFLHSRTLSTGETYQFDINLDFLS